MAHPGGRPPGVPGKRNSLLAVKLEQLNCHPDVILARVAMNDLECSVCRGLRRSKYKMQDGNHAHGCERVPVIRQSDKSAPGAFFDAEKKSWVVSADCECEGISDRVCPSCLGTGMEACSVKDRKDAAAELMTYRWAKLKAVEHTGADGEDITIRTLVVEYK